MTQPVFLLGAGASVDADIPDTYGMTKELISRLDHPRARFRYGETDLSKIAHFVCGALIAYDTQRGTSSAFDSLDVERVFAAVELLAERRDLEVSPFVSSWVPAVDEFDRKPSVTDYRADRDLRKGIFSDRTFDSPSKVVRKIIQSEMGVGDGSAYRHLMGELIIQLRKVIGSVPKSVGYLSPLVRLAGSPESKLNIASLNYDLAIEGAAQNAGIEAYTGIAKWAKNEKWAWGSNPLRLLKLHGSIDWVWDQGEVKPASISKPTIAVSEDPVSEDRTPVLVFGARGKLTARGPFLSLLAEFSKILASTRHLVVVGYSFRDDHVNEAIRNWLVGREDWKLTIIDPGFPEDLSSGWRNGNFTFSDELIRSFRIGHDKSDPRIEIVRKPASTGIADVASRL